MLFLATYDRNFKKKLCMYAQHMDVLEYAKKKNLLNYGFPEPYLTLNQVKYHAGRTLGRGSPAGWYSLMAGDGHWFCLAAEIQQRVDVSEILRQTIRNSQHITPLENFAVRLKKRLEKNYAT